MAVIHSFVFCGSYKYVKSLFWQFDSLAVAFNKIEGTSFTYDPDKQSHHTEVEREEASTPSDRGPEGDFLHHHPSGAPHPQHKANTTTPCLTLVVW